MLDHLNNLICYFISDQIFCSFCSFLTTRLEAVFAESVTVFVGITISFLEYFSPDFLANDKKPYPLTYFLSFGSVEYLVFYNVYSIISAIFTLSSISSGLLF